MKQEVIAWEESEGEDNDTKTFVSQVSNASVDTQTEDVLPVSEYDKNQCDDE